MALFAQSSTASSYVQTSPQSPFVGDPETGLLHRSECQRRPPVGIGFHDRQSAAAQGYACCICATPALVAPTDRIRALLATTLQKH